MPHPIQSATHFDQGITAIETSKNLPATLPDRVNNPTGGDFIPSSLKALWNFSTTQSILIGQLQPVIGDPRVLTPTRYYSMAHRILKSLKKQEASSIDPEDIQESRELANILEREKTLNSLVRTSRQSHLQG